MTQVDQFDLLMTQTLRRTDRNGDCFMRMHFDFPATKKVKGHRMGSGRGKLDEFYTPVRAGDIIMEFRCKSILGMKEAYDRLKTALPFHTDVIEAPRRPTGVREKRITTRSDVRRAWRWTKGKAINAFERPGK